MKFRSKKEVLAASEVDPVEEQQVYRRLPSKMRFLENAHPVGAVLKLLANIKVLYAMLRDSEFRLGMKSKAIIIAALAYFILPFDLIPDYIPGAGYFDDAAVVSAVLRALINEVESYKDFVFRKSQQRTS